MRGQHRPRQSCEHMDLLDLTLNGAPLPLPQGRAVAQLGETGSRQPLATRQPFDLRPHSSRHPPQLTGQGRDSMATPARHRAPLKGTSAPERCPGSAGTVPSAPFRGATHLFSSLYFICPQRHPSPTGPAPTPPRHMVWLPEEQRGSALRQLDSSDCTPGLAGAPS